MNLYIYFNNTTINSMKVFNQQKLKTASFVSALFDTELYFAAVLTYNCTNVTGNKDREIFLYVVLYT